MNEYIKIIMRKLNINTKQNVTDGLAFLIGYCKTNEDISKEDLLELLEWYLKEIK